MVLPDVQFPGRHAPRPGAVAPGRAAVQARLDAYVRAWTSFDPLSGRVLTDDDNIWVLRFSPDGRCAEFHERCAGRPETAD